MDKPLTLRREEFVAALVNLLNGSGLPAFAVVDILDDAKREMQALAQRQVEADRERYEASLQEEQE